MNSNWRKNEVVRTQKHHYLYYHVFSPHEPDGDFPEGSSDGAIYSFPDSLEYAPKTIKLTAWEYIQKETSRALIFHYHGMFMQLDNFGRYHYKGHCPEVEKAWNLARAAYRYGV
jgi:hypothetical protein